MSIMSNYFLSVKDLPISSYTWKDWIGVPHGNAPNNVWATAFYDIQELNRVTPVSSSVFDLYYDFYDSYFLVNDTEIFTFKFKILNT